MEIHNTHADRRASVFGTENTGRLPAEHPHFLAPWEKDVSLETPIVTSTGEVHVSGGAFGTQSTDRMPQREQLLYRNFLENVVLDDSFEGLQHLPEQLKYAVLDSLLRNIDLFRMFDINGDGVVTFREFMRVLVVELQVGATEGMLRQVFNRLDTSNDGYIQYEEMHKALSRGLTLALKPEGPAFRERVPMSLAALAALRLHAAPAHTHALPDVRPITINCATADDAPPPDPTVAKRANLGARLMAQTPAARHAALLPAAKARGFHRAYPSLPRIDSRFLPKIGTVGSHTAAAAAAAAGESRGKSEGSLIELVLGATAADDDDSDAAALAGGGSADGSRPRGPSADDPWAAAAKAAALPPAYPSFPGWEIRGAVDRSTRRSANKLAIVCHPLHGGRGYDTPELRVKHMPLFRKLIEAGWSVLAYEGHPLSADGGGDEEGYRLRAALSYVGSHREFRYCRVAILSQGTGASATLRAMANHPEEFAARVVALSCCEPDGDVDVTGHLGLWASKCPVPVLLTYDPDGVARKSSEAVRAAIESAGRVPLETLHVSHDAARYGTTHHLQASRLFGDMPGALIDFLRVSAGVPPARRMRPPRGKGLGQSASAASLPAIGNVALTASKLHRVASEKTLRGRATK